MSLTNNTCFHCGRHLSDCSEDGEEPGCNYCSILYSLLRETAVEKKHPRIDGTVLVLFVFILLSIALAIVAYNWRSDAVQLAYHLKQKVTELISGVCCLFSGLLIDKWSHSQ